MECHLKSFYSAQKLYYYLPLKYIVPACDSQLHLLKIFHSMKISLTIIQQGIHLGLGSFMDSDMGIDGLIYLSDITGFEAASGNISHHHLWALFPKALSISTTYVIPLLPS